MSTVKVSAYTVYPAGYDDATFSDKHNFTVRVEDSGRGWAIRFHGRCLNRDGEWEYESIPGERSEEFFARCRFPEQDALERAEAAVDGLRVNGVTIAEADVAVKARLARLGL